MMNGKSMLTSAVVGLVGLLGGCSGETWVKDKCQAGDLSFEAEYTSRMFWEDSCALIISNGGGKAAKIEWINRADTYLPACDDGKIFDKNECVFFYNHK